MTARPLLAVSPDSRTLVCVAEDRVALIDAAALTAIANADAPVEARGVGFVGPAPQLAILTVDRLHTLTLASLTTAAQLEVPGGTTIAAIAGDRVVLAVPGGLGIARCTATAIELSVLTTAGPADLVVGLDADRLLVAMPGRTEIIAAASQRVVSRLAAPLPPPPRIAGLAGQRRYVWVARLGHRGLTILRLSDGRTFEYQAAAAVIAVHGHADSPWLVVQHGGGLERVHVQTLVGHPLDADASLAACGAGGAEPALLWIAADLRFMRTTLGGDAVAPGAGLQLQVSGGAPAAPAQVRPAVGAARPTVTTAATLTAPAPAAGAAAAPAPRTWRPALADWARAVLAEPTTPVGMPVLDGTPVDELATRLRLPSAGYRALALLYGAWLGGGTRPSLDRVGRTIAWEEIGGAGALPRAQLVTVVGGRVGLRPAVARFLDEAAPARIEVHGVTPRVGLPPGRQRAQVSSLIAPATSARTLAAQLGAAAITDEARAGGRRGLIAALDEAWLRRLPLIVVPSGGLDLDTLAAAPLRRDHALVVVWPDRDAPPAIEDWAEVAVAT